MKVWIVRTPSDPQEPWDVDGVFGSLDKAIEYSKTLPPWKDVTIEEWTLDLPKQSVEVADNINSFSDVMAHLEDKKTI